MPVTFFTPSESPPYSGSAIQTLQGKNSHEEHEKHERETRRHGRVHERHQRVCYARTFAPLLLRSASHCNIFARVLRESAPVYHVGGRFTDALSRRTCAKMLAGGRSSRGAKVRA